MARPRTPHVAQARARLITRLRSGLYHPGDRFMSNRAVADQFNISYQTADRLLRELCDDGYLIRRAASGTYVAGPPTLRRRVRLVFHQRARRAGSFGARLLAELSTRLRRERIPMRVDFATTQSTRMVFDASELPVIWESPPALAACIATQHRAVLLNDQPPTGLAASFIDSVAVDDYSGGVCAAQLLTSTTRRRRGFAILAGPTDDRRSRDRISGFVSVLPGEVIASPSWFQEGGQQVAGRVLARRRAGVFCCNDRLAEGLIRWAAAHRRKLPPIVGFDDAPVAEAFGLTTIAIPWAELIDGTVEIIKHRLTGNASTASRRIFAPRPILRGYAAALPTGETQPFAG